VSATVEEVVLARMDSPLGPMLLAHLGTALIGLEFEDQAQRLHAALGRRFPAHGRRAGAPEMKTRHCVEAYFDGEPGSLEAVSVRLAGTVFQRQVWQALRQIPVGETRSYAGLARLIGAPRAVRAVGRANGLNPVSLVVPCHRLVGSDGSLTGYAGGLARKRWLLQHEGAMA
jgi:methylated-DNA-[protein]-cysteine S-methyltransferase